MAGVARRGMDWQGWAGFGMAGMARFGRHGKSGSGRSRQAGRGTECGVCYGVARFHFYLWRIE